MILMPLGLAVTVLLALSLMRLHSFLHEHRLHKVLFHLATGHHADGHHRNNRTWRQAATRSRSGHHMGWLARRSRTYRMVLFWGGLLTVTYTVIGWFIANTVTVVLLWLTLVSSLLVMVLAVVRRLLRRAHRRAVVHPIAAKLAERMKCSPVAVARNLRIRPNLDALSPGDTAVILGGFPDEWTHTEADKSFVENIFAAFLSVPLAPQWDTDRYPMRFRALVAASAPKAVTVAEHAEFMDSLGPGQYFLGCTTGGARRIWDTNEDEPMAKVGGRTRGGKTNLNLAIAGPALRRGERVSMVDPKKVSAECLNGVPGFRLANNVRDIPGMWQLIKLVRAEMEAVIDGICLDCETRRSAAWNSPCSVCGGTPRPHMLILEEINRLWELFRDHWQDIKEPGELITAVPPWRHVKAILQAGAQFGYRVLVDGQDLTHQVLFGARSQFGTTLMTRFTEKQWMYAVGVRPVPPSPTSAGRFYLVRGGAVEILQVVCADPRKGHGAENEAGWREFALGGDPSGDRVAAGGSPRRWPPFRLSLPRGQADMPRKAIPAVLIGNPEGAAYLGMSVKAFMMARGRQPIPGEFTTDIRRGRAQPCWTRETLDAWRADRPLAGAGRGNSGGNR